MMVDDEISHTAESYVNGGLSTIESILVVSRFNVGAGGRHYHRNPKNLQRNCSMSWAIIFCLPRPLLGDNFCVHWLYLLVSCWANIFVCSSSYGNNLCVHWLSNLFLCSKYMKIFTIKVQNLGLEGWHCCKFYELPFCFYFQIPVKRQGGSTQEVLSFNFLQELFSLLTNFAHNMVGCLTRPAFFLPRQL